MTGILWSFAIHLLYINYLNLAMFSYFTNLTWSKLAKITWVLIGVFIAFVYAICLFKYFTYAYNYLDLGIFNQVFYNSANGHLFNFTIHPSSYLGDHFELIIFFLIPFYTLWQSPLCLLLIQAIFAGLCAIPLYLIAKKHLSPLLTLLVVCLYLFNPATINFCLFEFHILPLAIFFTLWAFYFYEQNKFWTFLTFCGLSLIVREDIAFIIFMFGLIALIDRKKLKWILTPALASLLYFFLALKITSYFSISGHYQFLIYYGWLGNSLQEIIINFFLKFPSVIFHVISNITHLELIVGLLVIFLFIPLYRPKYLLLAGATLLEFILGPSAGMTVIQSHYSALFLPALLIATIFSLEALANNQKVIKFNQKDALVLPIIIASAMIYNLITIAPIIPLAQKISNIDYQQIALKNEFAKEVPPKASLLTSLDFIETLSGRSQAYPIHYAFFNQQQFSLKPYELPNDLQYVLLNEDDLLTLDFMSHSESYHTNYFQGDDVLRKLLENFKLIKIDQNLMLWQRNSTQPGFELYKIYDKLPKIQNKKSRVFGQAIEFLGYDKNQEITSLYFKCLEIMDKNYFIQLDNHYYSLGYGIFPTSAWQVGQIVKMNLYNLPAFNYFEIQSPSGTLGLGGINAYTLKIKKTEILGQATLD
jgi:uncharacterized membrane protein